MTYFVDTDWVVDWLAGRVDAVRLLEGLSPDGIAISLITYGASRTFAASFGAVANDDVRVH